MVVGEAARLEHGLTVTCVFVPGGVVGAGVIRIVLLLLIIGTAPFVATGARLALACGSCV